ncbi:transcription termination factor 2 [Strongylocentrotus purpuratus]|uniref:Transcription termination factor 2 n=1 Tax=Strongylocentrotus purpuratus TaxID=7668 RepID=A0A7M7LT74_STRPU|nr:transcription termination factor 2 [Strongylocentrotus purpuratus]|eukprot:XP_011671534.1 PREDICTED: transcription termination factor 2 isoform X2 [Strongylocentrotus purpuratus]
MAQQAQGVASAAHSSRSLQQPSIKQHFTVVRPARYTKALQGLEQALETRPSEETEADDPSHLEVTLMPHQKQALAWMLWREAQESPCGGILADEPGLGQNETVISLVIKAVAARKAQKGTETPLSSREMNEAFIRSTCTLVICPASLIDRWVKKVERCCMPGQLHIHSYHGPNRERHPEELAKYDMVFTSYNLIRSDLLEDDKEPVKNDEASTGSKNQPALLRVFWDRIILDEADNIKNHKSQTAIAICRLRARARWAVTGYLIQNSTMDMFSLIRFLKFTPFDEYEVWKSEVENAGSTKSETLQKLVKSLVLRRTKDQQTSSGNPIVSLPEKEKKTHLISLSDEERKIYDQFLQQSRSTSNKTNILVILLRLRQCCCHLSLLKELPDQESCEMDGIELDLVRQMKEMGLGDMTLYPPSFLSTKIKFVINLLEKIRAAGPADRPEKSVLVSQWTGMLDVVEHHLKEAGFKCWSIDGDVSPNERDEALKDFNYNPRGRQIMLVSLRTGGATLNLSGGNHLFFLDMHWNPALEDQACDRIYRIGQTRKVHIHKFICSDTIEYRISELQKKKKKLANDVLTGSQERLSGADLDFLFGVQ